ncbi:hypothetical protein GH714_026353 [Hevea brasiliensis]|uniref:DUF7610 domain-containing protein n=1 Tax=Hevea brasiliensis TaxID=3981 RepID=A0A6A6MFM6_HEVBR|nr:hypothetical protein GH714_026353 [Hevea brasiliensis]
MTKPNSILDKKLEELESKLNQVLETPYHELYSQDIQQSLDFLKTLLSAEITSSPSKPHHFQHIAKISDLETAFGNWNEFRTTITHDHVKQENGYVEALVEDDEKAPLEKEGTTHDYVEMFSTCSCTESCLNDEGEASPEMQEHVVKALVEDEKAPLKRKGEKGVGWVLGSMAGGMLIGMALMGFVMARIFDNF